jgi:hypothetical protein
LKPIIINERFTGISGFTSENSIIYVQNSELGQAMIRAIAMRCEEYERMVESLKLLETKIYEESINNLKKLLT